MKTSAILQIILLMGLITAMSAFAQTTEPVGSSSDAIMADIDAAHQHFKAAVNDPADIADPARRKAIAPKAIPPLKTMVADYEKLAIVDPRMQRRSWQIHQQFTAFLVVLGDAQTIEQVQKSVDSKDTKQSLNAQCVQLLAKWVLAGKNQDSQTQIADQVQTLDRAHRDNEALTFLSVTLSQSTQSPTLSNQLLNEARHMQNALATNVRKLATTQS